MNLISCENISKRFGEKLLFENINFGIQQGQKVGLIAINGSGKSTLMQILAGIETADEGNVTHKKNLRLGFLTQEPSFNLEHSVIQAACSDIFPEPKLFHDYELAQQQNNQNLIEQTGAKITELSLWNEFAQIKKLLSELKLNNLTQKTDKLSGGQKKRIKIASLLYQEPELLFLDEPTNQLDIELIEWLENYLSKSKISLLLVTHDRYFLNSLCNQIVELDNGELYSYSGNYADFVEKKAEREENLAQTITKAKNLMRTELEWMRRMPKARGTKSKSRITAFYDLKTTATQKQNTEKVNLSQSSKRLGKKIIELQNINKRFGEKIILEDFSYVFKRSEKLGIVGENGSGKSTFLKILASEIEADSGKIEIGETLKIAHYKQEGIKLKDDIKIIDFVKQKTEKIVLNDKQSYTPEQFLEQFLFSRSKQYQYISSLSGGEKKRLQLCMVLMESPNLLILDEPTNDLDLLTINILEDYLAEFPGVLIIVSHDRFFMNKLVEHIFVFEGEGEIKDYYGTYSEYLEITKSQSVPNDDKPKTEQKRKVKEKARKLSYKEKRELESLEPEIEKLETEKKELLEKLNSGETDFEKLNEWSRKIELLNAEIDEKTLRWLELSEIEN